MAAQRLTDYERRRLENIKRNDEMLAALKVRSTVRELSAETKRQRAAGKSYKVSPSKKAKPETPIVLRRSLRSRGVPPDASTADGLKDDFDETLRRTPNSNPKSNPKPSPRHPVPISMRDAYSGEGSDGKFTQTILGISRSSKKCSGDDDSVEESPKRVLGSVDLESLKLDPENIARVVPGRIMAVKFFPSADLRMVAVGNKYGNVGFWNVDAEKEDGDGIYLYYPHSAPVSSILVQPFSISKVHTSSYDGFIRLMDVEKEMFDLLYSTDSTIFCMSRRPSDANSLFFCEGQGVVNVWDERAGKISSSWSLHENRINTIDFSSKDTNMMATSSTDGRACIWDLRKVGDKKPKYLMAVNHKRAVHSAYFSPSGSTLATTSIDDKVGLLNVANFEDQTMIFHNNQTGRWISSFRGIWGWDDSCIFIGNMKRGVDIISAGRKRHIMTLESPELSAIPCRFDAHPYKIGLLAGATSGGQVIPLWLLNCKIMSAVWHYNFQSSKKLGSRMLQYEAVVQERSAEFRTRFFHTSHSTCVIDLVRRI